MSIHSCPRLRLLSVTGLLIGALSLFGCPKRPVVVEAPPAPAGPSAAAVPAPPPPAAIPAPAPPAPPQVVERPTPAPEPPAPTPVVPSPAPQPEVSPLQDVFFDFDRDRVRPDQHKVLHANVAWLKAHPQAQILIEGHCDERGTPEYNLGLGERRAQAVRQFLVRAGIPAKRIAVVSYGEERPFAREHDERAWRLNRRAHFVVLTK